MTDLLNLFENITVIPDAEKIKLAKISTRQELVRGTQFIPAGNIPQKFGFVATGLFRYYYTSTKGAEFTKGFFQQGSFIAAYSAMIKQTESHYAIEALEDSVIYVVDYRKWLELYHQHPSWAALLIKLLEKGYMKKEKREREFLLFDAEERYRSFLTEYPGLESRVKQHMVASYLGITPVALSRIRGKMKPENFVSLT
jgi:CRP-like cAMP-binding protein